MDFQKFLDNAVAAGRAESLKSSPQMTVGEAIATLENSKLTYESDGEERDKHVYFDFEYLFPTGLDSWRGSYAELAITFDWSDRYAYNDENKPKAPTGKEFLTWLKKTVGKTYTGYKGGDFTMGKNTPLWVANYGNSGDTGLVAIEVDDFGITLRTWKCEL